jgi:tetratricopeptide (TPR) repeat protein/predicted Ser/Thr protein kinase
MKIDPATWPTISKLLDECLDLPADSRSAWLANLGPEYSDVLPAMRQLLAFDTDADDDFLRTLPRLAEPPLILSAGRRLGPYRILSLIGRGGMGVVYRAERDDGKFAQRVAIKVVSGALSTPAFSERLEREYRILATLEHPNIARLLDAGTTEDGLPYFVMEFVEGRPIDRFSAERKLSVRERLRLLLPVCDAVQFAHQNLIVHRDLKPDNILVSEQGIPKLLDFGIAKVLSEVPAGNEATLMAMTPDYASPEQVRGGPIGTATDVYSLGSVLYKMLTGVSPHQLQGKSPAESVRLICEEEPRKPSAWNRELGRDEDNLLQMAMHKEMQRRYRSVEQFAADIGRYLNNEPVAARPASAGYRMQKYVRRHRIGVGVAAGLLLLLAGFATVQAGQLRRITRERDRADRITGFMSGMFKVSDPGEARGNSITAREILDKASKDIDTGLAKDPELQAQMMGVMEQVYGNLGLYVRAQTLLTQALAIQRRVLGPNHPQTLRSMDDLVLNLNREGHYAEAEKLQRETLDLRLRDLGLQQPDTLKSMSSLAITLALEGRYAEAERLQRETLDLQRRVLGPEHPETLRSMNNLANTLNREGHYTDAERLQRETLNKQRRVLGPEHPETMGSMGNLANTLNREGRYTDAEKLQQETLDMRRRILSPEHPDTLVAMTDLAATLKRQRRYSEAEEWEREALDIQRRVLGPEHPSTLMSMNNLSTSLNSEGRYAEAERLLRTTLDIKRRVLGPEHPETLRSMVNLATSLLYEGHYSDAEKLERETLDTRRRVLGPEHPDVALSAYNLAIVEEREGKRDEALRLLREAVDHGLSPGNSLGIEKDSDLNSLHGDPRFEALVRHAKERVAATANAK